MKIDLDARIANLANRIYRYGELGGDKEHVDVTGAAEIKQLIRDCLNECKPDTRWYDGSAAKNKRQVHEAVGETTGFNAAIYEFEQKQQELLK